MQIRQFRQHDLEPVLEIQTAIRTLAVWRGRDYEQLAASPQGMILVAESEARILPEIVGFSAFYRIDKESELWNVAVRPSHRRQDIGRIGGSQGLSGSEGIESGGGGIVLFVWIRAAGSPEGVLPQSQRGRPGSCLQTRSAVILGLRPEFAVLGPFEGAGPGRRVS